MSTRLLPRPVRYILAAIALAGCLLLGVNQLLTTVQAARQQATAGNTYVVNSTADTVDADVGNSACADASGHCTLRAAIMQANFATGLDTITLPSGVYVLTRPGNDDDATVLGDLDIADDLTIQGAGSSVTIVDGNGAVTFDRVFQVLSSAKETSLSGLTIRAGKKISNTFDEGGGLYWDGGGSHLRLHDVVFDRNTARYGGGLYLNYSSVGDTIEMDHVVVHANTATTGAAGGLGVNFGDFAGFDLRSSRVYSNAAYEGGGIYFQGTPPFGLLSVCVETTEIYSNTASLSAGIENHSGNAAVPVVVVNSHMHNNHADFYGGAVGNYGTLVISDTTLNANSASISGTNSASTRGGGLYNYEGGQVNIIQSTLSENLAASGGGIYSELFIHNNAALTMTNSTLSGNSASRDGGGLYAVGGHVQFFNATIANNHVLVPLGTFYTGMGGGLYITATAIVTAQNTLFADNTHRYQVLPPEPDDCFASVTSLRSLGYNLIETPNNCLISGTTFGNITGQDPLLGPLQNNGGSTQTQAPLTGSPAIDHGDDAACPPTDQRGFHRPIGLHCDIGAVEYYDTADLAIAKNVTPPVASPGQRITYTLVLTNNGPAIAQGIVITDPVPSELTNLHVISSGVAITLTGSNPYVWQVDALGVNSRGVITVTGVVDAHVASAVFTNTVSLTSTIADPDTTNNTGRAAVAVPQVSFASPIYTVTENVATGVAHIGVSLLPAPSEAVTVHFRTTAGTATPGGQYLDVSGQLAFAPGESSQSFSVPILKDYLPGPNRTVNLILSDPNGALLVAPSTATLVIVDSGGHLVYLPLVIK